MKKSSLYNQQKLLPKMYNMFMNISKKTKNNCIEKQRK